MTHEMTVERAQKMDAPTGLFRWVCACGGRGGVESERAAVRSGCQHIKDTTGVDLGPIWRGV